MHDPPAARERAERHPDEGRGQRHQPQPEHRGRVDDDAEEPPSDVQGPVAVASAERTEAHADDDVESLLVDAFGRMHVRDTDDVHLHEVVDDIGLARRPESDPDV